MPAEAARHWSFADASAVLGLETLEGGGPLARGDLEFLLALGAIGQVHQAG